MSAIAEKTAARFHTSLNVSDLWRSVPFYRALFGLALVKEKNDYAKFDLDDPPLVLSLLPGRPVAGGTLNHVGHRSQNKIHCAIYLGPFASVTDDSGNTFGRGITVRLNIHDWQALSKTSCAGQFFSCHPLNRPMQLFVTEHSL